MTPSIRSAYGSLDQKSLHSCWGFMRCTNTIMIIFMEKSVRLHTFRNPGCCLNTSWIYQNEIMATAYFHFLLYFFIINAIGHHCFVLKPNKRICVIKSHSNVLYICFVVITNQQKMYLMVCQVIKSCIYIYIYIYIQTNDFVLIERLFFWKGLWSKDNTHVQNKYVKLMRIRMIYF